MKIKLGGYYEKWILIECLLLSIVLNNEFLLILNKFITGIGRIILFFLVFLVSLRILIFEYGVIRISKTVIFSLYITIISLTISLAFETDILKYIEFLGGIIILSLLPFTWKELKKPIFYFSLFFVILNIFLVIDVIINYLSGNFSSYGFRLAPSNTNPIFWGRTTAITIFCTIILLIQTKGKIKRFFLLLLTIVFFIATLLTNSRGPILALIVSLIIWNISFYRKITLSRKFILYVIQIIILTISFFSFKDSPYFSRIMDPNTKAQENVSERIELWKAAYDAIALEPLFGSKASVYYSQYNIYPHNIILDLGLHGGLITIFAFLLLLLKVVSEILKMKVLNVNNFLIVICIFSIFLIDLVSGMFSGTIDSHYFIWFCAGLLISYSIYTKYNLRNS